MLKSISVSRPISRVFLHLIYCNAKLFTYGFVDISLHLYYFHLQEFYVSLFLDRWLNTVP